MKTHPWCAAQVLVLFSTVLTAAAADDSSPPSSNEIAAALQPYVDSGNLAGAVTLVADKDKVLSLDAVGFADIAAKMPMIVDALFWIASQSKPITARADDARRRRQGNLDDPVEKYLPEFKGQWLAVEQDDKHCCSRSQAPDHRARSAEPHQRPAIQRHRWKRRRSTSCRSRDAVRSYADDAAHFEPGTKHASIPTPASTRPGASSRWSAACRTRISWTSACSSRSA